MASEQVLVSKAISKAVTEVTRTAMQTMATATAERPQCLAGLKIGRPTMKQSTFNWEVEDEYSKLNNHQVRGK